MHILSRTRLASGAAAVALAAVGLGTAAAAPAPGGGPPPGVPSSPAGTAESLTSFQAPLVNGYGADPTMAYDSQDGYYYLTYNRGDNNDMVMRRARSLSGLQTAPDVVIYSPSPNFGNTGMGSGGFLDNFDGHWYIYNGTNEKGNQVLESAGPTPFGPYHVKASFPGGVGPHNSGYAFEAEHIGGKWYGFETSNGEGTAANSIYITTMGGPTTITGSWHEIITHGANPFGTGWDCGGGPCINEGTSIAVHDGRVFDIFSAGTYNSPDYCVGMAWANLSSDLLQASSWTKSDHCVVARNDAAHVYGPGSMTFFNGPKGQLWVVYHVKTTTANTPSGSDRRLEAAPVTWGADGFPQFQQPYALGTYHPLPAGDPGLAQWVAADGMLDQVRVEPSATAATGRYVTAMTKPGSSVSFRVTEKAAGRYRFRVLYASGAPGPVTQDAAVNGKVQTSLSYPPTGSSSAFATNHYADLTVDLPAGTSRLSLQPDGGGGSLGGQLGLNALLAVPWNGSQEAVDASLHEVQVIPSATATGFVKVAGTPLVEPYYVGSINYSDSTVTFTVTVPQPGTYPVQVYYDNGATTSTLGVSANGGSPTQVAFPSTGSWGTFNPHQFVTTPVTLNAGVNTITFAKGTNYAELDRIYVPSRP